jgi:broad specificity phosphatase PhoE
MKTTIIMIRHGQSVANAENRFAGHSNFDLTELGRTQAELGAKYYADKIRPDVIYSSDLLRAYNTALPFAKVYGLPIIDRQGLRELYAGKWEGLTIEEIAKLYTNDLLIWRDDFSNARCTGGESTQELYARVVEEILTLAGENLGKTVLAATHATPIRAVEAYAKGFRADEIHKVEFVKNASLNVFEYDNVSNSLVCVRTNIVDHLDESLVTSVPRSLK